MNATNIKDVMATGADLALVEGFASRSQRHVAQLARSSNDTNKSAPCYFSIQHPIVSLVYADNVLVGMYGFDFGAGVGSYGHGKTVLAFMEKRGRYSPDAGSLIMWSGIGHPRDAGWRNIQVHYQSAVVHERIFAYFWDGYYEMDGSADTIDRR